jgi:hypothetical protein
MVTAELQAGISSLTILKQMADRLNRDIKFELLSPGGCIETMSYVVLDYRVEIYPRKVT